MSKSIDCINYNPQIHINKQLMPLGPIMEEKVEVFNVPYLIRTTKFVPLKVNEVVLTLSLTLQTILNPHLEKEISKRDLFAYDRFSYTIRCPENDRLDVSDFPSEKIEQIIQRIFHDTQT